jgi:hypothetical protein
VLPLTPVQSPQPVSPQAPQQKTVVVCATCFNCGCVRHFAQQCPTTKKGKGPRVLASTVIQQRGQIRAPTPRSGCINHTTVEDIPEGEEVLVGTFLLFGHPIIILFDFGASHDFMSVACTERLKLALTVAKPSYMISTPRGRFMANKIAREVPLELAGQLFPTNHLLSDGYRIDVILGMSWMKLHNTILDIAKQLVYLDSPIYGKVALHLQVIVHINAVMKYMWYENF